MKKIISVILLILMGVVQINAQTITPDGNKIIYVDSSVVTSGNGNSWITAVKELADALKYARDSAANYAGSNDSLKIYIAKGTYFPLYSAEDGAYQNDSTRDNAFVMVKNVQLYGGFPSGGGIRDWQVNPTILSGDIGTRNNKIDNCYHVVIGVDDLGKALLNGLTITKGNADGSGNITVNAKVIFRYDGGGILNYNNSSGPIITNVRIDNNTAYNGGGMYNYSASPTLKNVTIANDSAANYGGGMCNYTSSSPTLTNVTIVNSYAGLGGGIYNYSYSSPNLTKVTIANNTAANNGGGVCSYSYSSPTLTKVTIANNSATSTDGGGMYNYSYSSPALMNVMIVNNSAANNGGGMCNSYSSSPILTNVEISNNSATNGGGVFSASSSPQTLTNVTIANNAATYNGGGMSNNNASSPTLMNSVVFGNTASTENNIYNNGSSPTIKYSLIEGNTSTANGNLDASGISATNIFVDSANADYHLKACSPAVNVGSNMLYSGNINTAIDLAGNPRLFGDSVDLGAYEYPGAGAITSSDSSICLNDSLQLTNYASGGGWSSKHPAILTIDSTGKIQAVSAGMDTVYYIVTNTCVTDTASIVITVNSLPTVSITGNSSPHINVGDTLTATGADTYIWSTGSTGDTTIIHPTVDDDYTVIGTDTITGCSDIDTFSITINTTGIAAFSQNNTLFIYPNPVHQILNLDNSNGQHTSVEIYTIAGKKLQEVPINSKHVSLDFSKYKKGVYLLKIRLIKGEIITKKVMKE